MNKTNRRSSTVSRKSPSRRLASATKSARPSSPIRKMTGKMTTVSRSKPIAKVKTTARRLVSRVKRAASNAIGARKSA